MVPVVAVVLVQVLVQVLPVALVPSIGQVCAGTAGPSREHLPVSLLDCAMALLR